MANLSDKIAPIGVLTPSSSIKALSDVYSSMTPTDGQVLTYDTTNGWQAETAAESATVVDSIATTSGTAFDLTSIPSGTNKIEVVFANVGLNGGNHIIVQIGTGGSLTTSGYSSASNCDGFATTSTSGFVMFYGSNARFTDAVMTLHHMGGNVWGAAHCGRIATFRHVTGGGHIALGGELDTVRLTRTGSNSFDLGNLKWRYE